ncbi:Bug family tripartite tricarboxylate transporter substrate binding protein [Ottowia thiooxydans]|uniref:Bug family tripartite tricarboxylate transporter substrate binding protein n=1 Tax=Ottowia thiooxydans TaxID=219182 RepID=UPI00055B95A6|nr:tripartite tricarboxylate transporter substrate binding protein [Ottowia thiooxydans]
MNFLSRQLLLGVFALPFTVCALAQTPFPAKPITLVVPFAPGGGSDAIARVLAVKLGERLKQPVIVENKPGAGGTLATAQVARSSPDGYTLLLADTPFTANISVYPKPGYSAQDFTPIALVASVPSFIVVGKQVPVENLGQLISLAKKEPGKLNMASGGAGGVAHLAAARFALATGVEWAHVPYRGMSPAVVGVMSEQADVIFATAPTVLPQLKSGKIKTLAITSASRSPFAPEVPSVVELGLPQLVSDNWYGVVAPKGTQAGIVKTLLDNINQAMRDPDTRSKLTAMMATPTTAATSQEFGRLVDSEVLVWAKTVRAAHINAN